MNDLIDGIRPSPIAGQWYEGDPMRLRAASLKALNEGTPLENVIGLIVPHAGHVYSGATAAKAFKAAANNRPETIVILSPHHAFTRYQCISSAYKAYGTPLGSVEVDHARLRKLDGLLRENGMEGIHFAQADSEHAIEIQLPFLQAQYDHPFKLLPVMLRDLSKNEMDILVDGLFQILTGVECLIVSSTDLSHFNSKRVADLLDGNLIHAIRRYSVSETVRALTIGGSEACGATGLLATMALTERFGGKEVQIIERTTSAAVTGDHTSVVGYLAAAITS